MEAAPTMESISENYPIENLDNLCIDFLDACRSSNRDRIITTLQHLRSSILHQGITETEEEKQDALQAFADGTAGSLTLRGKIWKAVLGVGKVDADAYLQLIEKRECTDFLYDKIRGDSFRTFPESREFTDRVPEKRIIRVLNCFVHEYGGNTFSYVQGMNAVSALFLYIMPELDAYHCFCKMIVEKTPLYWVNDVVGAYAGCMLVDEILALADPELDAHLKKTPALSAYVYAFSLVTSLCASVPPFSEVLQLWDFLISFGPHLNLVCVVAQIILMRDKLLAAKNPKNILDYRKWPHLQAKLIINVSMQLLPKIPSALYHKICLHAVDPVVAGKIAGRQVNYTPMKLRK